MCAREIYCGLLLRLTPPCPFCDTASSKVMQNWHDVADDEEDEHAKRVLTKQDLIKKVRVC